MSDETENPSQARQVGRLFYEESVRAMFEESPELRRADHSGEGPETWEELEEADRTFFERTFANLAAAGAITFGLPTTGGMPVYDTSVAPSLIEHNTAPTVRTLVAERDALRDAQRPLVRRLEELRTATIAARQMMKIVTESLAHVEPGMVEAATRWVDRYGKLADPPLEIEVEDDDDPADTPTEGEYWTKEPSGLDDAWRSTPEAARERAVWTRDIADVLRAQTAVEPHLRPGFVAAADLLDPRPPRGV